LLGALILAGVFAAGCDTSCDTGEDSAVPVRFTEGQTDPTGTYYETNSFDGQYLHFPPGRRYELIHGLGRAPLNVDVYLAFHEYPAQTARAAGNEAVIERMDVEAVHVRNDTCAEFYLRAVLTAPPAFDASDGG
jgi:hypothetical protein